MQDLSSLIKNEFVAAMNNHDIDRVVQCFDNNATLMFNVAPPGFPQTLRGKKEIQRFFERMIQGFHAEPRDFRVNGDQVQWTSRISSNMLKQFGVDTAESNVTATVKNGKILSFSPVFSSDVTAKLQAASLAASQTQPRTGTRPATR